MLWKKDNDLCYSKCRKYIYNFLQKLFYYYFFKLLLLILAEEELVTRALSERDY